MLASLYGFAKYDSKDRAAHSTLCAPTARSAASMPDQDIEIVRPNGQAVRRRRQERGWPPRELINAISRASVMSSGLKKTITPTLLLSIEDHSQAIPYETLCLVADGLHCDPVDILAFDDEDEDN